MTEDEIRALIAERDALRAQVKRCLEEQQRIFLDWRGVETPCKRCQGAGTKLYSSTATWHGGAGGQTFTLDVCDACWGTGDALRKGANLRSLYSTLNGPMNPLAGKRICEYCGGQTRVTTAGCDNCDFEDK